MTIGEAISRVDRLKYNVFSLGEKQQWLGELEAMLKRQILDTHGPGLSYTPIGDTTPPETELLAPEPFDTLYIQWLEARIDLYNGETERYNASIMLFNHQLAAFARWYHRSFPPKDSGGWQC